MRDYTASTSCLVYQFWMASDAAAAAPPSPIQHRLYAAVDPLPLPPCHHLCRGRRPNADTPRNRRRSEHMQAVNSNGEKGRKMCFACSNGRWLYYIYVCIYKHAVRYVAVACGVLSRRLIHYLPDGTTFLIDSSSFHDFFFRPKSTRCVRCTISKTFIQMFCF